MLPSRRTIGRLARVAMLVAMTTASPAAARSASQATEKPDRQPTTAGPVLGRVVDATTGQPVRGAVVSVPAHDGRDTMTLTDGDGRFVFTRVAAGSIRFGAVKGGYHEAAYGQLRPRGEPRMLTIGAGERRGDVVIRMWKHSVITGVVRDEAGEPIVGVEVLAERRAFAAGRPRLTSSGDNRATTDDRGVFRLSGLQPGSYVITIPLEETSVPASVLEASPSSPGPEKPSTIAHVMEMMSMSGIFLMRPGQGGTSVAVGDQVRGFVGGAIPPPRSGDGGALFSYPTTFYPAARVESEAVPIVVAAGEERAGVDFVLRPVRAVRVSGTLVSPDLPVAHRPLHLLPIGADGGPGERPAARVLTDTNGRFTFLAVPAGEYRVHFLKEPADGEFGFVEAISMEMTGAIVLSDRAFTIEKPAAQPAEPDVLWAEARVAAADRDVTGLTLTMRAGTRVSGRGEVDGLSAEETRKALADFQVFVSPAGGRAIQPSVGAMFSGATRTLKFDEQGRFDIMLPPGTYVIRSNTGGGFRIESSDGTVETSFGRGTGQGLEEWMLTSVQHDGREIADAGVVVQDDAIAGLVLTFSKKSAAIDGTVKDASGAPDPDATVVVFPTNPSLWTNYGTESWRVRKDRASLDGTYGFSSLPAGDYFVVAVADDPRDSSPDPEWLGRISRNAIRVTLGAGERRTVALRAAGGR